MRYILETDRLRLRELRLDDTAFIIELLNSPGWLKYIGDRNVKTEEQAKAYLLNGPIRSYRENGFGLSLVELKENNQPIGMCGIIKRTELPCPDIGFALLPEFTGMGYAFEIASATLVFAQEKLKLGTIQAIADPGNKSSVKLLEKLGMKFNKPIDWPATGTELLLFSKEIN